MRGNFRQLSVVGAMELPGLPMSVPQHSPLHRCRWSRSVRLNQHIIDVETGEEIGVGIA